MIDRTLFALRLYAGIVARRWGRRAAALIRLLATGPSSDRILTLGTSARTPGPASARPLWFGGWFASARRYWPGWSLCDTGR
jgi:hypothetical protein